MKTMIFIHMCECLKGIAHEPEPKKTADLNLFMSQGYLFLDLTEKTGKPLKAGTKLLFYRVIHSL